MPGVNASGIFHKNTSKVLKKNSHIIIVHFIKLCVDSVYGGDATSLPYQTAFPKVKFKKKKKGKKRLTTCLMQMGKKKSHFVCVLCLSKGKVLKSQLLGETYSP